MANFDFDQAEGLRRMLAGPKPRIVTFLSATPEDDKGAMLVNLGASLAQAGNDVLLVDARGGDGIARRLGFGAGASLLDVARQQCALNQVIHHAPQGFGVVGIGSIGVRPGVRPQPGSDPGSDPGFGAGLGADDARRLAKTFDVLVRQGGIVMVDGEFGEDNTFPLNVMAESEIVVQVSTSVASITNAYSLIKRLSQQLGRRPFGILVTNASETEAKVVYDNMATAASRYLAVQLTSMGSVPADEYLHRAARLGRSVIDAFPLAGASVAFRRLAGRFTLPGMPQLGRQGDIAHPRA